MSEPKRIQRKRTKGWRMPEGAVYVGRPTRWGNPFIVGQLVTPPVESYQPRQLCITDRAHAVKLYRRWLTGSANRCADLVPLLGGRDLACWCPLDQPCHADVLLDLANQTTAPSERDRHPSHNPPAVGAPKNSKWGYLPCGCTNDGYGRHVR